MSAGSDATLRLWDPVTGSCQRCIKAHTSEVTAVVWWPDGQSLITGSHDKDLVRLCLSYLVEGIMCMHDSALLLHAPLPRGHNGHSCFGPYKR